MFEYDFSNIHLPQREYRLLRRLKRRKRKYSQKYDNLILIGMVNYCNFEQDSIGQFIPIKDYCKITEKGLCYLQYSKNYFVDNRLPILISVLALIVSLIAA